MNVTINPTLKAFLDETVKNGRYRTASEAMNEAVRLLRARDEEQFRALKALLTERMKESERGEAIPFDEALVEDIRRRGMERLAKLKTRG